MRMDREITARKVRLIDEKGEQLGVVDLSIALKKAEENALNLVEVSPATSPPVCRIMNYGKTLFHKKKRQMKQKKKQRRLLLKEIKFRLGIEQHDYQVKINKLRDFLEVGHTAKVVVRFSGREMAYQERGVELIQRVYRSLSDIAVITQEAKLEGRQLLMILARRQKKDGIDEKSEE